MWFEIIIHLPQCIIFGCIGYAIFHYARLKHILRYYIMECDELIEQMLKDEPDQHTDKHKERLTAVVAGGKCSQYLGGNYTTEKINNMTDEEIKKTVRTGPDWELRGLKQ